MTYDQYLISNHWKRLRRIKLESVGYRCERCESTFYLQVHHRTYASGWFNTTLQNLEVLCWYCHRKEHGHLRVNDRPIYTQEQRDAIVARLAPKRTGLTLEAAKRLKLEKKRAEQQQRALVEKQIRERNKQLKKTGHPKKRDIIRNERTWLVAV